MNHFFQVKQLKKWSTRQFQMNIHYSIAMFSKNYSLFYIVYLQPSFLPRLYSHSMSLENIQTCIHTHTHTHTDITPMFILIYTYIQNLHTKKQTHNTLNQNVHFPTRASLTLSGARIYFYFIFQIIII